VVGCSRYGVFFFFPLGSLPFYIGPPLTEKFPLMVVAMMVALFVED